VDEVTIYHNPECGTSRNVLALLRHAGLKPRVIEYLQTPPSRADLKDLAARSGWSLRDIARVKGTPFRDLGLDRPGVTENELLDAMLAHPILINRPLVVSPLGVKLCRPSDVVLDLLPTRPAADFAKEDGAPFLVDESINGADPALVAALAAAGLPTQDLPIDDLVEPGRSLFAYRTLAGTLAGFGGFERFGEDALLRSVVVVPALRGRGIGRNLGPLLMRRAFDAGARHAWLLTTSPTALFERIGFKPQPRDTASAAIAATRQFASLCPASARLLSRPISF
jgi:arsenate reductase